MGLFLMKVYLDSNIFIYAVLDTGAHGENARHVLHLMEEEKFEGVTGFTTFEELVFVVLREKGMSLAIDAGKAFLLLNNLEFAPFAKESMLVALEFMNEYKLKPRDAMHLAAMKSKKVLYLLTEDSDFNVVRGIKKYSMKSFLAKFG